MADPKLYANLPGIDFNSPDVFETSDLPEEDQQVQEPAELSSKSVEKIPVSTDAAFKAFQGKKLQTDFSDSVGKARRTGYFADKTEYELAEAGVSNETPQQKYQRLQHEIKELAEDVSKIQENVKQSGTKDESMSPVVLGKNLEYLQHQLADLNLEKMVGSNASIDLSDPQGALRQRLMKQLESFGPSATNPSKDKSGVPAVVGDQVSYELYYRPEQTKFSRNAKLANLEERLERLENVIGKNQDKLNILTADTHNKSLIGAVAVLNTKLSLLEPSNTDTVEARLNAVLQQMQQVMEKKEKEPQADPENHKKIVELYDLVKQWEATADSLPQVVDRLISLKELHEQALEFSQAQAFLDTAQQKVNSAIGSHTDMLTQVKASMLENNKTIEKNIESIEKRLKALEKS